MNYALAACRGQTDVMFGADTGAAIYICEGCSIRADCLDEALKTHPAEQWGIWAGLDAKGLFRELMARGMSVPERNDGRDPVPFSVGVDYRPEKSAAWGGTDRCAK